MTDGKAIQGELQAQIMAALWRLEAGTVEQVRADLPTGDRSAYTTIQTVLNRLAVRGLLLRERVGPAIVYRPGLTEAQYLERTIKDTLDSATPHARQVALAQLIGGLSESERSELERLRAQVDRARGDTQR